MKYKLHRDTNYLNETSKVMGEVMVIDERGLDELMLEPYTKSNYSEEEWLLVEEAYTRMKVWYQELDLVDKIMLKDRLCLPSINDLEINNDELRDFILNGLGTPTQVMELF